MMPNRSSERGRDRLVERAEHGDTEAAAALIVLDAFAGDARAWAHVDVDGIHWAGILDEGTWSSGERRLLEFGKALWKGYGEVDVAYLFAGGLGDGMLQVVVDAITARRSGRPLPAASDDLVLS